MELEELKANPANQATTIADFQLNGPSLVEWTSLLEEWLLITERFYRLTGQGDDPYKYNERVHIGILAGAAWRCGWGAVEEFKRRRKTITRVGRADLWLCSPSYRYLIEAKFKWLGLGNDLGDVAEELVNHSYTDALAKSINEEIPCGVSFLCPVCYCESTELVGRIQHTLTILKKVDCHAIAWCFSKYARFSKGKSLAFLPGIILMAQTGPRQVSQEAILQLERDKIQ